MSIAISKSYIFIDDNLSIEGELYYMDFVPYDCIGAYKPANFIIGAYHMYSQEDYPPMAYAVRTSNDWGITWNAPKIVRGGTHYIHYMDSTCIKVDSSGTIWIALRTEVYTIELYNSTNYGLSFSLIQTFVISRAACNEIACINIDVSGSYVYVSCAAYYEITSPYSEYQDSIIIYRSENGGTSFTEEVLAGGGLNYPHYRYSRLIANGLTVCLLLSKSIDSNTDEQRILRSTNGGNSFSEVYLIRNLTGQDRYYYASGYLRKSGNNIVCSLYRYNIDDCVSLIYSTDFGATWNSLKSPATPAYAYTSSPYWFKGWSDPGAGIYGNTIIFSSQYKEINQLYQMKIWKYTIGGSWAEIYQETQTFYSGTNSNHYEVSLDHSIVSDNDFVLGTRFDYEPITVPTGGSLSMVILLPISSISSIYHKWHEPVVII